MHCGRILRHDQVRVMIMADEVPLYCDLAEAPEHGRAFWVRSGRKRVRCAVWDGGTRGTVLIFTGRTEYIEKYGRIITELCARGFNIAVLDWRGQGLSERPLGDGMKGHVADFAAYQMDVDAFCAAPEVTTLPGPRVLMCHSMGGCIGMRSLLDERVKVEATIMSAPMLGVQISPVRRAALVAIIAMAERFDFETSYVPGTFGDKPYVSQAKFAENMLTTDRAYFDWFNKHLEAEPAFGLGGPTIGWMSKSGAEMAALAQAPAPDMPMLMFLGSDEEIVSPAAIRTFAARAPRCELVELDGAKHEVLMETPALRTKVWAAMDRFLAEQSI